MEDVHYYKDQLVHLRVDLDHVFGHISSIVLKDGVDVSYESVQTFWILILELTQSLDKLSQVLLGQAILSGKVL